MVRIGVRRMTRFGACMGVAAFVSLSVAGVQAGVAGAALGEGRMYEQVSPESKAGYPVYQRHGLSALAGDGEAAKFVSVGRFSGSGEDFALNPYAARRTPEGWLTEGLFPQPDATPEGLFSPAENPSKDECWVGFEQFSADLSRFEFIANPGASFEACTRSPTDAVWVRGPDGVLTRVSPVMTTHGGVENGLKIVGGSADLSHLVIKRLDEPSLHLTLGDGTEDGEELYEAEASSLRLLALDNGGQQMTRYCEVYLGGKSGAFGAISQPNASEVFFSVPVDTRTLANPGAYQIECTASSHPEQLFLRTGGSQTIEISKPFGETCTTIPCPGAETRAPATFQGASEDGAKVFFTTKQPLIDGDKSNNLYVATIGCAGGEEGEVCGSTPREVVSLALVSDDRIAGQPAEVASQVAAVSPDGSHVYFVAHGALSENPNEQGEVAVDGADNLYVADIGASSGPISISFIAELCSGSKRSGSDEGSPGVSDDRCPESLNEAEGNQAVNDSGLWLHTETHEAQTTPQGDFLVFGTYARLIDSGPEADTDSYEDIYRYDAQTGSLRRVSLGEAGADGNGNGNGNGNGKYDAKIAMVNFKGLLQEQYELGDRAITENGSEIVFTTSEPLATSAVNGEQDVYIWNEGHVGMISGGSAVEPDEEPIISLSGRDVLFLTSAGLVSGDSDGLSDLYDARVSGGFPPAEPGVEECSGEACHGPLPAPGALLVPGSMSQPAGGNLPTPTPQKHTANVKATKETKKKLKKTRKAKKKTSKARTGSRGRRVSGSKSR